MDLILRNARRLGAEHELTDIAFAGGKIAAIEPGLAAEGEIIDLGGRLVSPGFVETHIHLDKSCILDRCKSERGDIEEAIAETAKAKAAFTPQDVHSRAIRTLGLWWKSLGSDNSASTNMIGIVPGMRCRVRTSISLSFRRRMTAIED